ncbi:MAG: hypothetical protein IAE78_00820, partial [Myxococcus sp.]|nr:hypothetical protein [Myxococcus sp.]
MTQRLGLVAVVAVVLGCASEVPSAGSTPVGTRSQALAPANDSCSGAVALTVNTPVSGTTAEAGDDFHCEYLYGADVVYSFSPATTGAFRAVVTASTSAGDGGGFICGDGGCYGRFDPFVYVTDPPCDAGVCRPSLRGNSVTFRANAGTSQFLVVDGYQATAGGAFSLVVNPIVPPSNDTCASPAVLPLGANVTADFSNALDDTFSLDGGGGCSVPGAPDLIYAFTPPTSGRYRFTISSGALTLSAGACGGSCGDWPTSNLTVDLSAGTPYFLIADGTGTATVRVDQVVVPPNDACLSATPISLGPPVSGTTVGARLDAYCSTYSGPDVFYRFTPPSTGAYNVRATSTAADGGFGAFFTIGSGPGSCTPVDAGALLTCTTGYGSQGHNFRATANTPVSLMVQSATETGFQVQVSAITPPVNDTCASPSTLSLGVPAAVDLSDALDDAPASVLGDGGFNTCGTSGIADVFFAFTPPTTGRYRFQGPYDLSLGSGACGAGCFAFSNSRLDTDLVGGTTYWLTVESYYGQSGSLRVDAIVVPSNDRCVNALPITAGVPVSGTTVGAAADNLCVYGADVFYRFNAPAAGAYNAALTTFDGGYASLALTRGCGADAGSFGVDGGSFVPQVCEYSYGGSLTFRVGVNDPVNLIVAAGLQEEPFQLEVNAVIPASNDSCSMPQALSVGTPVSVSFANAFDDPFPRPDAGFTFNSDGGFSVDAGWVNGCGSFQPDLVYSFTPATSGRYEIQAPGEIWLGGGTCGASCSHYGYGSLVADLTAGTTWWVIVEGPNWLSGVVRVDPLVIPANDRCEAPQTVTAGVPVSGTTRGATDDFVCGYWSYGPDVVYQFTPAASAVFRAQVSNVGSDGGSSNVSWRTASCDGGCLAATETLRATSGTPYFVVVKSPPPGGPFQLSVNAVQPVSNDTCAAPLPLTLGNLVTSNVGNAVDDYGAFGGDGGACGYPGYNDVAFSFTAPSTDTYVVAGTGVISSSASCGTSCTPGSYGAAFHTLSAGQTMFFIVDGFGETVDIGVYRQGDFFDG